VNPKQTAYFSLANLPIKISFYDELGSESLIPSFDSFRIEALPNDELLLSVDINSKYRPSEKGASIGHFDSGAAQHDVFKKQDGGYQFIISDENGNQVSFLDCNSNFSHSTVVILNGLDATKSSFGLNNALMIVFAFASSSQKTLLVHASVVRNNDIAFLCLGKSGTGKSTHVGLWLKYISESDLINDDNPIVRCINGKVYVFGSPWSGKTPCYRNINAPIGGFLDLQQSPENTISLLKPINALAALLPSCSVMKWDRDIFNRICDTISDVLLNVPCYHLKCRPDKEAAVLAFKTLIN
jgi:hypothetical protein